GRDSYGKKGDGYKKDGYKKDFKKGGKGRDEKRERKPYIDPSKLAGLSYDERMKMYKEAYASGSVSKGAKDIYKNGGYKKDGYKKGSYKKGDYKKNGKKSYNNQSQAQKTPEKKSFWQKVKSFFGR
ncbi:MAG: RNA helicase, partial [Treponema sp.]|nr:RNA helicase [Treponema sp.]